jgi:hypothetical protein
MPDNGVANRVASNFENDFREFNGRPPTAEETKRHLAFDRLAKTSTLDPATVLLIVDAARSGTIDKALETICAQLDRLEQRADDAAKQPAAGPAIPADPDLSSSMARLEALLRHGTQVADPFGGVLRCFFAFLAGGVVVELVFGAISYQLFPPVFAEVGFFTLGLSATAAVLLWLWLAPLVRARRR